MFATAGCSIKLWDAQKYTLHQEIPSGVVGGLSWAQNGQCIASLGESSPDITLYAVNSKSTANIGIVRVVDSPSCIKFPCRSSHYLGVGSKDGVVSLWSPKTKSQKKAFSVTDSAISRIAFSHNDSHIAAASKGSLYILSTMNNSIGGPFKIFDKAVTDVVYSNVKKSVVGCCSEGGSVAVFDAHASKLLHTFTDAHASPVSGVSFSPINELLMLSVGYDKKFICYSIQTKKQILTHKSSVPLTSAALLPGCQQIALGGMTGEVFIHDLRTVRKPLATLHAHDRAVSYILLEPAAKHIAEEASGEAKGNIAKASRKQDSSSSSSSSKSVSVKASAVKLQDKAEVHETPAKDKPEEGACKPAGNPSEDVLSTIFSPVRSSEQTTPIEYKLDDGATGSVSSPSHLASSSKRDVHPSPAANKGVLVEDIFSPVRSTATDDAAHDFHDVFSPVRQTSLGDSPCIGKDLLSQEYLKEMQEPSDIAKTLNASLENSERGQQNYSPQITPHKENMDPNKLYNATVLSSKEAEQTANVTEGTPLPKVTFTSASPLSEKRYSPSPSSLRKSNRKFNAELKDSNSILRSNPSSSESTRNMFNSVVSSKLFSDTSSSYTEETQKTIEDPSKSIEGTKIGTTASHMEMELVRNCVSEVMEDFQDDVNRRMMHLQFIVTKQFLQLKDMMQQMQSQHTLLENVLLENERLRKENVNLRIHF